jgi:hypothetical protein
MFSKKLENKRAEQVLPRIGVMERMEVPQTMYANVSKCENDKIKGEKIRSIIRLGKN